ncbi:hypothetical protein LTR85_010350 [Meristemomyces frigidus]|nr:hypothetical protein LTR85_010350 [Meristemomyces frigidus]
MHAAVRCLNPAPSRAILAARHEVRNCDGGARLVADDILDSTYALSVRKSTEGSIAFEAASSHQESVSPVLECSSILPPYMSSPSQSLASSMPSPPGPDDEDESDPLRDKRHWTVLHIIPGAGSDTGDDSKVKVRWQTTEVPGERIHYDAHRRAHIVADGEKHYIAEKSVATSNAAGHVTWKVRWEDEWIDASQLDDLQVLHTSPPLPFDDEDHATEPMPSSPPAEEDFATEAMPSSPLARDEMGDEAFRSSPPFVPESEAELPDADNLSPLPAAETSTRPRARASTTSSAVTYLNPPRLRAPDLRFRPTRSDVEYKLRKRILRALRNGELVTSTGKEPEVIARWKRHARRRPIMFTDGFIKRRRLFNGRDHRRAESTLVHGVGYDALIPCFRCMGGSKGTFQGCVVMDGFGQGECTNCKFSDVSRDCSFHFNTSSSTAPGSRAADFVFSSHASASSRTSPDADRYRMSGGMGPRSPALPTGEVGEPNTPSRKQRRKQKKLSARRGQQVALANANDRTHDRSAAPSSKTRQSSQAVAAPRSRNQTASRDAASSSQSQPQQPVQKSSHRCQAAPSEAPSIPSGFQPPPKAARNAIVPNDTRFNKGEMTDDQFWHIYHCCAESNQRLLRNEFNWGRKACQGLARRHLPEYYRTKGCKFLNNYDPNAVPQDLKDWIDGDQLSDLKDNTKALFLYNSGFTELDLCHGLIYARDRLLDAMVSLSKAMKLAEKSYQGRIDISDLDRIWGADVGLGSETLARWQWDQEEGEEYLFSENWNAEAAKLRRTISAFCKLRVKMQKDDGPLRRMILTEQDDGDGPKPMMS